MLVSAIAMHSGSAYKMANSLSTKNNDAIGDTSFNSLTPFATRKPVSQDRMPQVFENINEWQQFCHKQILGGKLNIIA